MRGQVMMPVFESRVLRGNPLNDPADRVTPVYLPASYAERPSRRYPVLFALAGFTGSGRSLLNEDFLDGDLAQRLDRLIAGAHIGEAIVVMPDCMTRYGGSQYLDSSGTGDYATYLAEELVPWVDSTFRTIPDRAARGLFGKSSGGFGAIRLAMDRPDVFGAFACHSGDMAFEYCYMREFPLAVRYLSASGLSPREFLDTMRTNTSRGSDFFATINQFAMASCYSPDPGSELGFQLPFDPATGEVVPEVWARWLSFDPIRSIADRADALARMSLIFLDAGRRDEWMLDIGARIAADHLRDAGLKPVHEEFDGGHMQIPFRYDRSLPLLTASLSPAEG